jgi:fatty acid desaturase
MNSTSLDRPPTLDTDGDNPSEHEDYGGARISPNTLSALKRRSDAKGLTQLAGHIAWLALTGAMVWSVHDSAMIWPAMFVHGIGVVFVFAALHESVHRTPFASRWLNDGVALVAGFVVGLGAEAFRSFHFAHHRYTQLPGQDPELDVKNTATVGGYLYYMSGISYWLRAASGLVNAAMGRVDAPYISERVKPMVIREARVMLCAYTLVLLAISLGHTAPLVLWIVPMVLAQPLWRGWLLAEHSGCTNDNNIYSNTRTTRTNALVRFLAWQMPNHTAHHAYPGIPFHALGRTTALLGDAITVRERSYLSFHARWLRRAFTGEKFGDPAR